MSDVPEQLLQTTAYTDLSTSERTPVVQASAQYGLLANVFPTVGPSGTATEVDSEFFTTSGTDPNGFGAISTSDRLTFRPGEGGIAIFPARFGAGLVDSEQLAGIVNPTDGFGFGYNGAVFSVLWRSNGTLEIQTLTITTPAAGAENATINIDGTPFTVPLTAGTVQHNANEIAISLTAQVPLWDFTANDDQVVAVAVLAAEIAGAFTFSSATAVAAFVQSAAGVTPTDVWFAEADWNVSQPLFNKALLNNYKIQFGNGSVRFFVANDDIHQLELVHIIDFNNFSPVPFVNNPTFGFTWYALNRGGTVNVSTAGAFCGLFTEGKDLILTGASSNQNTLLAVTTTPTPLITIRNRLVINDAVNLASLVVTGISVTSDSTKPIIVTLIRNSVLTDPVFEYQNESTSVAEVDKSATAGSGQGISLTGLNTVNFDILSINLRRGETLTVLGSITSGAPSDFTATVAWNEDT